MMWDGGWVWIWMCVAMVAFWALLAVVIVTLVRQSKRGGHNGNDVQFARGEVDEDEYHGRRDLTRR